MVSAPNIVRYYIFCKLGGGGGLGNYSSKGFTDINFNLGSNVRVLKLSAYLPLDKF